MNKIVLDYKLDLLLLQTLIFLKKIIMYQKSLHLCPQAVLANGFYIGFILENFSEFFTAIRFS